MHATVVEDGAYPLADALAIAEVAHAGQMYGRLPYIAHVCEVVDGVDGGDAKVVAALHDVVEDTEVTFDDLVSRGVPARIVSAVDAVTHRQGESRDNYYMRVCSDTLAWQVKMSDVRANSRPDRLSELAVSDPARAERLRLKYAKAYRVLMDNRPAGA